MPRCFALLELDKDVRVGCMGVVAAFRDAAEDMQDMLLSPYDLGYGMDTKMAVKLVLSGNGGKTVARVTHMISSLYSLT